MRLMIGIQPVLLPEVLHVAKKQRESNAARGGFAGTVLLPCLPQRVPNLAFRRLDQLLD
jgi:hypothetical protein